MVTGDIEDQVVALIALGEVLFGVIDDVVCAERTDHLQFLRVVYTGHLRSVGFGDLYGEGTHTTAGAIDQHTLAWLQPSLIRKNLQGDESRGGYGRGLFERDVGRLQCQGILWNGHILGIGAAVGPLIAFDCLAEYLITWLKAGHVLTDHLNAPRHIRSRNAVLWSEQPGPHCAQDVRQPPHDMPDIWMDGSGANSHPHLIAVDHRLVDFS